MMAFNFKLPCGVTCPIISFRGVRRGKKHDHDEPRNDPKGQINNFVVARPLFFFALLAPPTCQSWSLLIGVSRVKTSSGKKSKQHGQMCWKHMSQRTACSCFTVYTYNNVKRLWQSDHFSHSRPWNYLSQKGGEKNTRLDTLIGRRTCLIITLRCLPAHGSYELCTNIALSVSFFFFF